MDHIGQNSNFPNFNRTNLDHNRQGGQGNEAVESSEAAEVAVPDSVDMDWNKYLSTQNQYFKSMFLSSRGTEHRAVTEALASMPPYDEFMNMMDTVQDVFAQEFPGHQIPQDVLEGAMERLMGVPVPVIQNT